MTAQREWFEKDYYKVLGVDENISEKELTKAYRKLARQLHPDANPGDSAAEERFKEVSAAYDVLGDSKKRAEYDEARRLGPMGGGFPGGFSGDFSGGMGINMEDLFGGLFGQGGPNRGRRGSDLETTLTLPFLESINGITTTVNITSDAACSTCGGNGAKPGTTPKICSSCSGRGVQAENQGPFSFSRPCGTCGGRGHQIDDPCQTCRSTGIERRPRAVKVRIPSGVESGQRIRLKGKGGPGSNGPNGDLFIRINVEPHAVFGRQGRHLTITVRITWPEAVLGSDVIVPTLDGGNVTLKIPAGTPSGQTFRIKGKGVTTSRQTGDLLAKIEVDVPTKLNKKQRAAVEEVSKILNQSSTSQDSSDMTG